MAFTFDRLTYRLIAYFLVISFVSIAATGYLAFHFGREVVVTKTFQQLDTTLELKHAELVESRTQAGMEATMEEPTLLGTTGETYLVAKDGKPRTLPQNHGESLRNTVLTSDAIAACLAGKDGQGVYENYEDTTVLGVYRFLPEFDACLLAEVHQGEVLEPINRLQRLIVTIGVSLGTFSLIAGIYFTRRITKPVDNLLAATRRISQGDLATPIQSTRRDEFGEIATALDDMRAEIADRRAELEKAYDDLKQVDSLKDDFLQSVSHELKTPLTAIIGLTQVLQRKLKDKSTESEREDLAIILHDARYLQKLINEILELTRLDAGREMYTMRKVDAGRLVSRVVDDLTPYAKQHNVAIEHVEPHNNPPVHGDEEALYHLVHNLANNAIKFTSERRGWVKVSVDEADGKAVFTVEDNGIGIAESQQERIFERFYQADETKGEHYGGTGLGLAICKKIADLHHGRLTLESSQGKGTTFYFHCPLYHGITIDETKEEQTR